MNKKNRKISFAVILAVAISCLLTGCMAFRHVSSKAEAIKAVSEALGYEPELTDSYTERSPYKIFRKNAYFEFADVQGMEFTYSSVLTPVGIDGATFYYSYNNKFNYNRRILPFYEETIRKLCDEHGKGYEKRLGFKNNDNLSYDIFGNEVQYSGAGILIEGFDDLEDAADLVGDILDECRIYTLHSVLDNTDICNAEITVKSRGQKGYSSIKTFKLLKGSEEVDREKIYKELYKNYIEKVKSSNIPNDVPEFVLENTNPDVLHGQFAGKTYDLWTATLDNDSDEDNPEYSFRMLYREPSEGGDYEYHEGYYSKDLRIQNFIAQLGGNCFFIEGTGGEKGRFYGDLWDNQYEFGFIDDYGTVLIRKNDKDYIYSTDINNPANNTYQFMLNKEQMEEVFDIQITYDNVHSIFTVEGNYEEAVSGDE